jgi:hypothetical protein
MGTLNRRTFTQLTTGALFAAASKRLLPNTGKPVITTNEGGVRVEGGNYLWEYSINDDRFRISDEKHREIVSGKMQPAIMVAAANDPMQRVCSAGKAMPPKAEPGKVTFEYSGVNGGSHAAFSWRFEDRAIWTDAITYDTPEAQDIVSLHYFCDANPSEAEPTLHSDFLVVPGICEGDAVSPILQELNFDEELWLGHGSYTRGLPQQWALPVDYFCGMNSNSAGDWPWTQRQEGIAAFTCGLAELPAGDLFLQLAGGQAGLKIDYRSDLWKQLRGPQKLKIGATLVWTFGGDYYESIAAYYQVLLGAGTIHAKQNSPHKTAVALTPEICTWGAQVERGKAGRNLDEAFLRDFYARLKASGMKAGLFSIDDKWEGAYGSLEHSTTRLPHFEEFLAELRADGMKIGIWAALMRCERPADLGLTESHMLQTAEGKPFVAGDKANPYFIYDFTQPEVEKVLSGVVRRFIRRYGPDVVKFDFGYELPAMSVAAPRDRRWAGELLMWRGLDIVIRAMREENPDQVVMYYELSPLFVEFFDLHSLDDLFLNYGEYDVEANRRIFFSSLMGRLGVPTYGSSGYDWASAPAIWFDSAAAGTIGILVDFAGDRMNRKSTPEQIAKYNGVAKTLRPSNVFEILPIGYASYGSVRGAHARSWARFENGELVLVAYRPPEGGDDDVLRSSSVDARVRDAVQADFPVIVSSRTNDDITRCAELAIAPYGAGTIAIRRQAGRQAQVRSHYLGDSDGTENQEEAVPIEDGRLTVKAGAHNATGQPLEWIEVAITR